MAPQPHGHGRSLWQGSGQEAYARYGHEALKDPSLLPVLPQEREESQEESLQAGSGILSPAFIGIHRAFQAD